jgi:hypothetical protein
VPGEKASLVGGFSFSGYLYLRGDHLSKLCPTERERNTKTTKQKGTRVSSKNKIFVPYALPLCFLFGPPFLSGKASNENITASSTSCKKLQRHPYIRLEEYHHVWCRCSGVRNCAKAGPFLGVDDPVEIRRVARVQGGWIRD